MDFIAGLFYLLESTRIYIYMLYKKNLYGLLNLKINFHLEIFEMKSVTAFSQEPLNAMLFILIKAVSDSSPHVRAQFSLDVYN